MVAIGKSIKVQSTAVGRRKKRISQGMKKTRAGRPPKPFTRKAENEGNDSDDFDRFRFRVRKRGAEKKA